MNVKRGLKSAASSALAVAPENLSAELFAGCRLVTFDVFDTLITRSCGTPEGVFEVVGNIWNEDDSHAPLPDFSSVRIKAAKSARKAAGPNREITIGEIYAKIECLSEEEREELANLEMACELAVCEPRVEAIALYESAVMSCRVALVSDTYLPSWIVAEALSRCGVEGHEALFVSSDYGVMKRDGRLFELVLSELGVDAGDALHLGDHPLADLIAPKRLGMSSILLRQKYADLRCGFHVDRAAQRIRELMLSSAPSIKRSKAVRVATWPLMTARYALGDVLYRRTASSGVIRGWEGLYAGKRCFIVGNGPSLLARDLDAIADEVTFGSNRVFNLYDRTVWRPTYYLAVDRDFLAEEGERLARVEADTVMLHRTFATRSLEGRPGVVLLNAHAKRYAIDYSSLSRIAFSERPDAVVYPGFTVTYVALQLAIYMGFSDIYLVGMDHAYSSRIEAGGKVVAVDGVRDHAYEDGSRSVVNAWNADGVEYAYRLAREKADARGVHIYNATRGGKLEVFERVDLDDLLASIKSENRRG